MSAVLAPPRGACCGHRPPPAPLLGGGGREDGGGRVVGRRRGRRQHAGRGAAGQAAPAAEAEAAAWECRMSAACDAAVVAAHCWPEAEAAWGCRMSAACDAAVVAAQCWPEDPDPGGGTKAAVVIVREVEELLRRNRNLKLSDFDGLVRQFLHAIHNVGGRQGVHEALDVLHRSTSEKQRSQVRNWAAYIVTILKGFFRDHKLAMRRGCFAPAAHAAAPEMPPPHAAAPQMQPPHVSGGGPLPALQWPAAYPPPEAGQRTVFESSCFAPFGPMEGCGYEARGGRFESRCFTPLEGCGYEARGGRFESRCFAPFGPVEGCGYEASSSCAAPFSSPGSQGAAPASGSGSDAPRRQQRFDAWPPAPVQEPSSCGHGRLAALPACGEAARHERIAAADHEQHVEREAAAGRAEVASSGHRLDEPAAREREVASGHRLGEPAARSKPEDAAADGFVIVSRSTSIDASSEDEDFIVV